MICSWKLDRISYNRSDIPDNYTKFQTSTIKTIPSTSACAEMKNVSQKETPSKYLHNSNSATTLQRRKEKKDGKVLSTKKFNSRQKELNFRKLVNQSEVKKSSMCNKKDNKVLNG